MKILLLAPQPFYQERGTPIAVDLMLRALSRRGDCVYALVYREGADVRYPGVRLLGDPALRRRLGLDGAVHFVGPRPVSQMAALLRLADVLVSPRLVGRNTPMKIYSYLDSGRAVLATDLATYTQLLTDEVALLASPTPDAFADGLVRLMQDEGLRRRLGLSAQVFIAQRHRYEVFKTTLGALYAELERAQWP